MFHILVANVGSTSLKYTLVEVRFPASTSLTEEYGYSSLASGSIERIGLAGANATVEHLRPDSDGYMQRFSSEVGEPSYASAVDLMLRSLTEPPLGVLGDLSALDAIGFKAVHGGLDRLVFTGGIGEKGASIRGRVVQSLACLRIVLDEERNNAAIRQEALI